MFCGVRLNKKRKNTEGKEKQGMKQTKREKMILKMCKLADFIIRNNGKEKSDKAYENLLEICWKWNHENPKEEIYITECWNDTDTEIIGFSIDDNLF